MSGDLHQDNIPRPVNGCHQAHGCEIIQAAVICLFYEGGGGKSNFAVKMLG